MLTKYQIFRSRRVRRTVPALSVVVLGTTGLVAFGPTQALACEVIDGGRIICVDQSEGTRNGTPAQQSDPGGTTSRAQPNSVSECPTQIIGSVEEGEGICGGIGEPEPLADEFISPAAWAQDQMREADLPAPQINTAPGSETYVGFKTRLWIDRAGFTEVSTPRTTIGGRQITATATPKKVEWDMGEGIHTCPTAGDRNGGCTYTYKRSSANQPGGTYRITATTFWEVNWACEGEACEEAGGELAPAEMSSTASLVVSEIQTNSRGE